MKKIYFLVLSLLCAITVHAQDPEGTVRVKGQVFYQSDGRPMSDVIVWVSETSRNAVTDESGRFEIEAGIGQHIHFSKLCFHKQEIRVDSREMYVFMEEDQQQIQEVTVRGRKNINDIDMREMAGAITTIDMTKLSTRPEMDVLRLLQGQVPGLTVTMSGELGTKPVIRIRGESSFVTGGNANEPLFVLDGVIISSEAFLAMNPEDFEEIKVLKDSAASALYGIKAANGVIEITSKRGFVGKPYVSFNMKQGITLRGPRGVEMMGTEEKLELERLLENTAAPGYRFSEDYFRKHERDNPNLNALIAQGQFKLDSLRGINTDWFKELIRISVYQSYSLGVRGGTEKNSYYYSVNYGRQGGRVKGNDLDRLTARASLDYVITPKLTISLNAGAGYSLANTPNGSKHDPTSLVYNLNPYEGRTNPDTGEPALLYSYPDQTLDDLLHEYSSRSTSKRVEGSVIAHWRLNDHFNISAVGGGDFVLSENTGLTPSTAYSQKTVDEEKKGELKQSKNTEFNYNHNIRLSYARSWGYHDLMLGANNDSYTTMTDNLGVSGHGIPAKITSAAGINQSLVDDKRMTLTSRKITERQLGIGAAAGYSYKNIYELYGSYKADASSLLPSDKRWNTAWSAGAGWRIGGYKIFKEARVITDAKVRISYGYTASMAAISPSSAVPTFGYSEDKYGDSRIFEIKSFYNKDIKPQQTRQTNVGFDVTFFKRITLQGDAYVERTKDAIMDIPIAPSNGFTSMVHNYGILQNSGYELRISGDVVRGYDFRWNTSLSLSYNRNKVVDLYDRDKIYSGEGLLPEMEVGKPMYTIYGLVSNGIDPDSGMPTFRSPTGRQIAWNDQLSREDFIKLGHANPPYVGFFNNAFSYKELTLSFDVYFTFGGIAKAQRTYVRDYSNVYYNAVKGQTEKMWFKEGDNNKIYHKAYVPSGGWDILQYASTSNIYKTDYIRLNNVQLNYRLPSSLLARMGNVIKYAHLNVQAQNLWTIQFETDESSLVNVMQPVITFGLNVTF